eukprot:jgi/Tetstr1/462207/TSEL_007270.t1
MAAAKAQVWTPRQLVGAGRARLPQRAEACRAATAVKLNTQRPRRLAPLRAKLFDEERQAELLYFDAMGVAEVTRLLFAAAEMPFKDNRYTIDFSSGKPQVEARHAEDKEAGAFSSNLGRLPLLRLPDGASIGQSKAIERLVARELGLMGGSEVEAAQIDAYCEHLRDIREAYAKAKGNPFAPPTEETEAALVKWFDEDMPTWMSKLEVATGASGSAVGSSLSLADVALFALLTQSISDERCVKSYAACPNISSVMAAVGSHEGVTRWLDTRPKTAF